MGGIGRRGILAVAVAVGVLVPASAGAYFGHLDPTFGGDGIVRTDGPAGASDEINDLVALDGGGLLAAGRITTTSGGSDLAAFKYEDDGALDTTFGGGDGIASVDVDGNASSDSGEAIELQSDGKIVVAGRTTANAPGADEDSVFVRFEADGTLDDDGDDAGFGGDGIVLPGAATTEPDRLEDVAVDGSGRVVGVGYLEEGEVLEDFEADFLVVRLTSAGALDTAFDGDAGTGNGIVRVSFGSGDFHFEEAYGVDLAGDGDVIVAGDVYTGDTDNDDEIGIARLESADGALVDAFGGDGLVTTDLAEGAFANGVVTSPDKITVVGSTGSDLILARYAQADGAPDASFGGGDGVATLTSEAAGVTQVNGFDLVVDGSGYVVSANFRTDEPGPGENVGAVAFTGSGQLDTDLAEDGIALVDTEPPAGLERVPAVAVEDDGLPLTPNKIVIGGQSSPDEPENFDAFMVRLGADETAPVTTIQRPRKGRSRDRTPTLRFTVSEPGTTSRCRIDSKPWIEDCASGLTFPRQPLGRHVIRVASTDHDGNVESPPAQRAFKIVR